MDWFWNVGWSAKEFISLASLFILFIVISGAFLHIYEGTIKQIIYNHKHSFTNRNYLTNTYIPTHMVPKILKNFTHHHLGNTRTSKCRQQDIKNAFLASTKTSNYDPPIKKHPVKQNIRYSVQTQTWEQTSILTFRPINITHLSYQYHLHF